MFTDTHCHIHSADYPAGITEVLKHAAEAGVNRMICVGTDEHDSEAAVRFVADKNNCWASLGLHPHDAVHGAEAIEKLRSLVGEPIVIAIGECGLDYFYDHSPRDKQIAMLRSQIELALEHDLPMIFHVREAFDDFWPIFDSYQGIRGVLHSFTDTSENLGKALERNLYIGVNGISTFTKVESQRDMYRAIPLDHLLLETDAPFLTPVPHRGTVNEPAFVTFVAKHVADLQHISLEELSVATNRNATSLFSI
jgi:TatD DNase family protein